MLTSNRIPHNSGLYHEQIFDNNKLVAQLLSESNGTYWWVITANQAISRGYQTVSDAKKILFSVLECK
jgi:hypothetical protein